MKDKEEKNEEKFKEIRDEIMMILHNNKFSFGEGVYILIEIIMMSFIAHGLPFSTFLEIFQSLGESYKYAENLYGCCKDGDKTIDKEAFRKEFDSRYPNL